MEYPDVILHSANAFDEGLEIIEKRSVSFIILDIDVPGGNHPSMIPKIRQIRPEVKILVHTALEEKYHALPYFRAGADGFLTKTSSLETIKDAIKTVVSGERYISFENLRRITEYFIGHSGKKRNPVDIVLSARELDVINLLLKGKWTKEIANQLGLQITTVSTHKGRIFDKFGVDNIIDLYKAVQREMPGLLKGEVN